MIIKNIAECPFTPNAIDGKNVRKIFFRKIAICY